jgi:hypothetical protein
MLVLIVSSFAPYPSRNANRGDGHSKHEGNPVCEGAALLSARAAVLIVGRHISEVTDHRMRPLARLSLKREEKGGM